MIWAAFSTAFLECLPLTIEKAIFIIYVPLSPQRPCFSQGPKLALFSFKCLLCDNQADTLNQGLSFV